MYDFGRIQSAEDDKFRNSCMTSGAYGWQATIKPNIKGVTSDCGNWALLLISIDL